ncbi:MAG TPA: hypothetical protein VGT61_09080 [Thermomicrobiales bacterium]|jgi:hypothetical protein|nr:hypothetical protein [Thermomicrobiales bacterium]
MSDESVREDRAPWDDEPTATFADRPSVDQLLPPVQLRPELADYGDYGDWMKLDPVMPRLAPDLARRCETCRDFRPAADGERGWCANKDAFTVRKVVYADELPCMNSFGCWWVPYDDIWLSEASVREHRNPTPLLDQLMPELNDWTREDRRRGS